MIDYIVFRMRVDHVKETDYNRTIISGSKLEDSSLIRLNVIHRDQEDVQVGNIVLVTAGKFRILDNFLYIDRVYTISDLERDSL